MASVSKNVYIDRLDDIVNKYNNTSHSTIKMKPADIKSSTYTDFGIYWFWYFRNMEIFLQNATLQIGLKKFLWLKKLKILCRRPILLVILTVKKLLELFMKKNCKNQIKKEFKFEKVIRRKGDKLYVQRKSYNNSFSSWIDKKDII